MLELCCAWSLVKLDQRHDSLMLVLQDCIKNLNKAIENSHFGVSLSMADSQMTHFKENSELTWFNEPWEILREPPCGHARQKETS